MARSRKEDFNRLPGPGAPSPESAESGDFIRRTHMAMEMMAQFLADISAAALGVGTPDFKLEANPDEESYTIHLYKSGNSFIDPDWKKRVMDLLAYARSDMIRSAGAEPEDASNDAFGLALDSEAGRIEIYSPHNFFNLLHQTIRIVNQHDWERDVPFTSGPLPGLLDNPDQRQVLRDRLENEPHVFSNMRGLRPYIDEEDLLSEVYTLTLPDHDGLIIRPRFSLEDIAAVLPDEEEKHQPEQKRRAFKSGFDFYIH